MDLKLHTLPDTLYWNVRDRVPVPLSVEPVLRLRRCSSTGWRAQQPGRSGTRWFRVVFVRSVRCSCIGGYPSSLSSGRTTIMWNSASRFMGRESDYRRTEAIVPVGAWSPDISEIVFVQDGNIWKINADGSNQTQLSFTGDCDWACQPNWGLVPYNWEVSIYLRDIKG